MKKIRKCKCNQGVALSNKTIYWEIISREHEVATSTWNYLLTKKPKAGKKFHNRRLPALPTMLQPLLLTQKVLATAAAAARPSVGTHRSRGPSRTPPRRASGACRRYCWSRRSSSAACARGCSRFSSASTSTSSCLPGNCNTMHWLIQSSAIFISSWLNI